VSIVLRRSPPRQCRLPPPTHDPGVAPDCPPRRPKPLPVKRTDKGDCIVEPDLVAPAQLCYRHVAALAEVDGLGEVHDGKVNRPRHAPPHRGSGVNNDIRHLIPSAAHVQNDNKNRQEGDCHKVSGTLSIVLLTNGG